MKENMVEYNSSGFFLFRNCFYDIELKEGKRQTVRLIDIKQDTLLFIGISKKQDIDPLLISTDTLVIHYQYIEKIHLLKDWGSENSKKIKCDKYYFIFNKTTINYWIDSKYANNVFHDYGLTELVPRLSAHGVTYHFEYGGKLYYHSGIKVQIPKYNDEEKRQTLNGIMTVLDLIVNKQVNITIRKK